MKFEVGTKVTVEKGCRYYGIRTYQNGTITAITTLGPDYTNHVDVRIQWIKATDNGAFGHGRFQTTMQATHPNRLDDDTLRLIDAFGGSHNIVLAVSQYPAGGTAKLRR